MVMGMNRNERMEYALAQMIQELREIRRELQATAEDERHPAATYAQEISETLRDVINAGEAHQRRAKQ